MVLIIIGLVNDAVQLFTLLVIVRAVLSWVPTLDYGHPLIRLIVRITDPVLLPVRRVIPPLGGLDISPIVAILLVQVAGYFLVRILALLLGGF